MKPFTIFLFFALLPTFLINAQVGIGTTNPNASLDIKSSNEATPANTDGILIPKIEEYPVIDPTASQDGMMVFATGNGSVTKGFYYWDNGASSWVAFTGVSGTTIQKLNDLLDAKSDNNGPWVGSSIFIGVEAGLNDIGRGYKNVGIGFKTLTSNVTGLSNTALGYESMSRNSNGNRNVAIGYQSLFSNSSSSYNVAIGFQAGYNETNSNRLYIENSNSTSPLIYGEFDNNLIRINGDFEVEKPTDVSITAKTPFGNKSSLKLFESGGSGDYGFEFEYDGSPDKFYLWSRTFAGNEGIRMTWLKNGRVGISTTSPNALLDISSTNPAAPKNTDGMLVPRIDAFPSSNPTANQNGMLVFLTTDNTFYFWRSSTTSWVSINTSGSQSINDLSDGKSDNDGSEDGSSVFIGIDAGLNDDGTDNRNVGVGLESLKSNTTGSNNTANGSGALRSNTTGVSNLASGSAALKSNTTGSFNTSNGYQSLTSNTTGDKNTANGSRTLFLNTTGNNNVVNGFEALYRNSTGDNNVANGILALYSNTTGNNNIGNGKQVLYNNSTGYDNVANGTQALYSNSTGYDNVANGTLALYRNSTGYRNVATGSQALYNITTGDYNTAIGYNASYSGNHINSTTVGYNTSATSNSVRLGNTSVLLIQGQVNFSTYSDKRVKDNVKENVKGLEFITKLRPVTYNFNIERQNQLMGVVDKSDYKEYEYLFKARNSLEKSNVIVINHSLLFSDLNNETGVL